MNQVKTLQVYISYSQADVALAKEIGAELQRHGFAAWIEATEIFLGDNWGSKIAGALQTSDAMVVLITPNSLTANNVRRDISYAIGELSYEHKVIPIISPDVPFDDVPWVLKTMPFVVLDDPIDISASVSAAVDSLRGAARA